MYLNMQHRSNMFDRERVEELGRNQSSLKFWYWDCPRCNKPCPWSFPVVLSHCWHMSSPDFRVEFTLLVFFHFHVTIRDETICDYRDTILLQKTTIMVSPQRGRRRVLPVDMSRSLIKAQPKKPEKWMPPPSILSSKQQQLMYALLFFLDADQIQSCRDFQCLAKLPGQGY